jgi:hypothetical protein
MADTDLPNGYGAIDRPSGPSRAPRPIASPFGMLVNPWPTPDPNQTPGFNVQPEQPPPAQTNPMAALASFIPSGQDLKQAVAGTLGTPADGIAWALHRMGLPIPGDVSYGGSGLGNTGIDGRPTWAPGPTVPLSSQNILGMMNNPPSWDAIFRAMRRPGLF